MISPPPSTKFLCFIVFIYVKFSLKFTTFYPQFSFLFPPGSPFFSICFFVQVFHFDWSKKKNNPRSPPNSPWCGSSCTQCAAAWSRWGRASSRRPCGRAAAWRSWRGRSGQPRAARSGSRRWSGRRAWASGRGGCGPPRHGRPFLCCQFRRIL